MLDIAASINWYQWYLTPVTFAVVALSLRRQGRKRRGPAESVDELHAEPMAAAEELEREATVHDLP